MIWFSRLSTKKVSHINQTFDLCTAYNCHRCLISGANSTLKRSHLNDNGSNDNGLLTGISDHFMICIMQEVNENFSLFLYENFTL